MVMGFLGDEDGQPVSIAGCPGNTPAPHTLAAQWAKVKTRVGVHELTLVGARGLINGQHIEARAQHGCQAMTAITQPQMEQLLRPGTLHMDLCAQAGAEGLADEGIRDGLRRHPVRAQEARDPRHAQLATLPALVATQNQSLTDPPRANAQGALEKLVAKADKRRIAGWVELTLEERGLTLTGHASAQPEAATLDGCDGRKTALPPAQGTKEIVHDRYQALASVEQAFRRGKTAHLAVRPLFLRRAARPRAHALVVMLAYQIMRYLASRWSAFDVTVAAGLHALTTRCLVAVSPPHAPSYPCLPTPRDAIARVLHRADITLPQVFSLSGVRVSTRKTLQSERIPQCIQLLS